MTYRLLLLALLGFAMAYLALARRIPLDPWSAGELVTSRTLPTLYGLALALVLLALLLREPVPPARPRHPLRAAGLIAVLISAVWLVPLTGIWAAIGLMLLAALPVMGERRPLPVLAVAAAVPGAGWLLVEAVLGIHVPGPGG